MSPVRIDPRPVWRIVAERSGRWAALAAAGAILVAGARGAPPEGLSVEGARALAIFAACIVLWVTSALPYSVTGIVAFLGLSGLGVVKGDAYRLFGGEVVFFLLGSFMLAAAIIISGLSTRLAYLALHLFRDSPRRLVLGVLLASAGFSLFMSEHAVAAFLYPIVLAIATELRLPRGGRGLGAALFLAMAWGSTIGGIGTYLGGGRNVLAVGLYAAHFPGRPGVSFFEWIVAAVPVVAVLLGVAGAVLRGFFRLEGETGAARTMITERRRALGRVKFGEKAVGTLFAATVAGWGLARWLGLSLADVSLIAASGVFVFGLARWDEIERNTPWEVLFMYAGAIGLGTALGETGATAYLADRYLRWADLPPLVLLAALAAVSLFLTAFISNSAAVAILLPVAFPVALEAGLDPRGAMLAIALAAGLDFALPVGTPAMAIAYGSGYLRLRDVLPPALVMLVASLVVLTAAAHLWWRPFGWL